MARHRGTRTRELRRRKTTGGRTILILMWTQWTTCAVTTVVSNDSRALGDDDQQPSHTSNTELQIIIGGTIYHSSCHCPHSREHPIPENFVSLGKSLAKWSERKYANSLGSMYVFSCATEIKTNEPTCRALT
jgi:hypothetical protein